MTMEDPYTHMVTNVPSYWANWRFATTALFILGGVALAVHFIRKYEGWKKSKGEESENNQRKSVGALYEDETWTTSFKQIHPGWLLGYRIIAFIFLLSMIVTDLVMEGYSMAFYYTEWTFVLVTIYFLMGSSISLSACRRLKKVANNDAADHVKDEEQGSHVAPTVGKNADTSDESKRDTDEQCPSRKKAGKVVYIFQVLFQICGGAVLLTDITFWSVLYPSMNPEFEELDFIFAGMHTLNAVCMIGEIGLNNMRFPFFRIAYFVLWTVLFVVIQWTAHGFMDLWWPYEFLDLASNYAPLWYLGVGFAHIPCYGITALLINVKQVWFSRSFSNSYRGSPSISTVHAR